MKRATWLINPRKIRVKIGKPVYFPRTQDIDPQSFKDAVKKVRDEVVTMHQELEDEKHRKV